HDGREVMVPFVKEIVPEVDLRAGRITVTPPPGLFEELEPEPAAESQQAEPDAIATDAQAEPDASATDDEHAEPDASATDDEQADPTDRA
ncbi:MAG TPA: hypothetical protein VFM87_06690, partial [Agrococcus sp.]|nr:hypothetical protein [Agrococcus sp.]